MDSFWSQYAERNQLFANDGTGRFRDISSANQPFCGVPGVYRGLACGDIDGDGALDLLVTDGGRPGPALPQCRSQARPLAAWCVPSIRRCIGMLMVPKSPSGPAERRWTRWVNPGYSYLCSNDPRAHFGLGPVDHVTAIDVLWPDGTRESFPGCPADQRPEIVLRKGTGTVLDPRQHITRSGSEAALANASG